MLEKRLIYKPVDCMSPENLTGIKPPQPMPQQPHVITITPQPQEPRDDRVFYVILSFVGLDFVLSLTKFIWERLQ